MVPKYNIKSEIDKKSLLVFDDHCELIKDQSRINKWLGSTESGAKKVIYYADITSIVFQPEGVFKSGIIDIHYPGGGANISFYSCPLAKCAYEYMMNRMNNYRPSFNSTDSSANSIASSIVDEIVNYKKLLDMGIISQEEFEKKKKEILGL